MAFPFEFGELFASSQPCDHTVIVTSLVGDPEKGDGRESVAISLEVGPAAESSQLFARHREPITTGLPFPKGLCHSPQSLALFHGDGRRLPLQSKVLDTWSDGSIRWALIDFQADVLAPSVFRLETGSGAGASEQPSARLDVSETDEGIVIDTGRARFLVGCNRRFPFERVLVENRPAIDPAHSELRVQVEDGSIAAARITEAAVEESGPLRTVVAVRGTLGQDRGEPLLALEARLHFFAGLSTVRFEVTVRNPRRAAHPGGYWDLGDAGSVYVKDLSLTLRLPPDAGPASVLCSPETGAPPELVEGSLELYQDSSGGDNWRSSNHINRHRRIPLQFQGYRFVTDSVERSGRRATPVVSLARGDRRLSVTLPQFWQNFPKALEATPDSIMLRLFPGQFSDLHEIQGGEQKTHTFFAAFAADEVTEVPLAWCRAPLLARATPSWYCATGAVPYLTPAMDDPHADYRHLVDAAIEGGDTFEHKRERIDEYGWRHFGDIYGDHETVFTPAAVPLISHYNNQYDAVAGFAYQFLRSGDSRWRAQMNELADHVIDIDVYHTDRDKSAYNNGLFWHTYHYVDADTATHRSYPRASNVGGGPSSEHNYTTGLMLRYFLTGDRRAREAAVGLARFVVNMDDGNKTVFRWLSRGRTGLATASGSFLYHGPGRGGANSLNALIDGHRLTGDQALLEKAEEIIRRAVHPSDQVDRHNLLDAERKWFYTMFLQSLGKYLDYKGDQGEIDRMYAYGKASLLHYARWMAVHEYPYLEKPEILHYPTETWAAQDMRKSEVFKYAAKHAAGRERQWFLDRSQFFFTASTKTLQAMSTRTLARPVVLMLSNGFMHAYFERHPETAPPDSGGAVTDFGDRQPFVPQKVIVKRRLKLLAGVLGALALTGAAYLAFLFA